MAGEHTQKLSPEVSNTYLPVLYGEYEHVNVFVQESQSGIILSSGATMTFLIPGGSTFNPSKTFIEMDLQCDAQGAGTYIWMYGACIPMWRQIIFNPSGGTAQTYDQYHKFSKMATQYLTPAYELKDNDISNIICPCRCLPSQNKMPANGFNGAVPYDETLYAINIDQGNANTAAQMRIRLKFSSLKGTFFAQDQDYYFGKDVQIQFIMEDPVKWLWTSTSANDPSAGAAAFAVKPQGGSNAQITNITLWVAIEQKKALQDLAAQRYMHGYRTIFPFVAKVDDRTLTGTSQQIPAQTISKTQGDILQRIMTAPYNGSSETANKFLDHCNQSTSPVVLNGAAVPANRVLTYQTMWKGINLQSKYINASPMVVFATNAAFANLPGNNANSNSDWDRYNDYYKGSCIFSAGVLGLNFFICDDRTSPNGRFKKSIVDFKSIEGEPIDESVNGQWLMSSTNTSGTYHWYTFAQTIKEMHVSPAGVLIGSLPRM